MPYGLHEKTIQKICEVFSRFPEIEKAILYGSRAKGNYKPGSDIDITLQGKKLTSRLCRKIADMLDDILLPYRIDISYFDDLADPDLYNHIKRVGVIFYAQKNYRNAC